jgi:hypothetical protein
MVTLPAAVHHEELLPPDAVHSIVIFSANEPAAGQGAAPPPAFELWSSLERVLRD